MADYPGFYEVVPTSDPREFLANLTIEGKDGELLPKFEVISACNFDELYGKARLAGSLMLGSYAEVSKYLAGEQGFTPEDKEGFHTWALKQLANGY